MNTMVTESALEQKLVEFYKTAWEFYKMTGHDLLEAPDKQEVLLTTDRRPALLAEGKHDLADVEDKVKALLRVLEAEAIVTPGWRRREALLRARVCCSAFLETANGAVCFKHLPLIELSRLGLNYTL